MGGGTPSLEAYPCRVLELWMRAAWNPCPCPVPAQPHNSITGGWTKTCQQLSVLPVEGPISLPCLPTPTWVHLGRPPFPNFFTPPFAPALGSPHISAFSRSLVPWVSQSYIV